MKVLMARKIVCAVKIVRVILLCVVLATLYGCGTVRAGLKAYRDISTAVADDLIAAVDGVAEADRDRRDR